MACNSIRKFEYNPCIANLGGIKSVYLAEYDDKAITVTKGEGGADDTYKTTLQAVAMAEIIQNANLPVHIMISGGTNSKTAALAKLCDINYWGIAVGSWARKIVKEQIYANDFWTNDNLQNQAIEIANQLIVNC